MDGFDYKGLCDNRINECMKKFFKIVLSVLFSLIASILLTIILTTAAFLVLNRSGHINGIAHAVLKTYVDGEIEFDSLHFDFSELPDITVRACNGLLVTNTSNYPNDTLCHFSELICTINPFRIFSDTLIDIPYVYLTDPYALVSLNKSGRPDWALWKFRKPAPPGTPKKKHSKIKLNIAHVRIYGEPHFEYVNLHTGMRLHARADSLIFKGRIAIDYRLLSASYLKIPNLDFRMEIPRTPVLLSVRADTIELERVQHQAYDRYHVNFLTQVDTLYLREARLLNDSRVALRGVMDVGIGYRLFEMHNLWASLEDTNLLLNGSFRKEPGHKALMTSMRAILVTPDLEAAVRRIPIQLPARIANWNFSFPLSAMITAQGVIWPLGKEYPEVTANVFIPGGRFRLPPYPSIDNLKLRSLITLNPDDPDKSVIAIKSLDFRTTGLSVQTQGELDRIFSNPSFRFLVSLHGKLDGINKWLPGHQKLPLFGNIDRLNLKAAANLKALRAKAWREFNIDLALQGKGLAWNQSNTRIGADSVRIDLSIPSGPIPDHTDTVPVKGNAFLSGVTVGIADTLQMRISKSDLDFSGMMTNGKTSVSHLIATLQTDSLRYRQHSTERFSCSRIESEIRMDTVGKVGLPNNMQARFWTRNIELFGDSSIARINLLGASIEGKRLSEKQPNHLLTGWKKWLDSYDTEGAVLLQGAHLITPVLPLDNEIDRLELLFTPHQIRLDRLSLESGNSGLQINGTLDNWKSYLLNKSMLNGEADILSDSLDLNQLVPAIARGILFMNKRKGPETDSLVKRIFPPNFIPPADSTKRSRERLIEVPANLNLRLNLDARQVRYDKMVLDSARGMILLADKSLLVNNMSFYSGLGNIVVNAGYRTPSLYEAGTDLSLRLSGIDVGGVLGMIPDLNSLVPILTTLDGNLGLTVTAQAKLDSAMYIEIPSLYSVASIRGENLTVEKDKILPKFVGRLLFGKRKDIRLDSIQVDLVLKDSLLSIYPFVADFGRYRIAASGLQELGGSFFYHFSLLKWPLLIHLGFNIYGRPHDLHFRLACPRLKDLKVPARILSTHETRLFPSRSVSQTLVIDALRQKQQYKGLLNYYRDTWKRQQSDVSVKESEDVMHELDILMQRAGDLTPANPE